ncbi:MAG TPA: M20/M25/M40 family metallo-hydrolase, partial [Holophagaceae bacterium]
MNTDAARRQIDQQWDRDIIPTLERYIEIPNQSPDYDPEWRTNGLLQQAVELARAWVEKQHLPGSRLEVLTAEGRTPMLLLEVEGDGEDTVLLYGHLDKQPPTEGWEEGLGAYQPVIRDGKLYGRGGADDGYALFATVSAIQALQAQGVKHSRLVTLIECCEESGSGDLEYYVDLLAPRIGTPGLVICLDSGCGNYEQLWSTASLRGVVMGNLTVQVLTEGVHSGDA